MNPDLPETRNPEPETPFPRIIAHRGASAVAPENTLAAFNRAIADGADGIEFDVRLSKDGVPVVIHDSNLVRTANLHRAVADMTADELARIDVGSCFNAANPRHARPEFADEGIVSLKTALQMIGSKAVTIYVELKCDTDREVAPLVDAVCREIEGSPVVGNIILKSFRLAVIPRVRALLPDVRTATLFAPQVMRLLRKEKYMIRIAQELGADHLSVHRSLASAKLVRKATREGIPVTVWTVNTRRWIPRAMKRGIFAVITNDPLKLLANREAMLKQMQ